jgi:hypothetical protein
MQELDWKVVLPSTIAIISLFVSLVVAYRNWQYSDIGVRYTSRNQYMNALFDIDRQLIARPELWAIYDYHEMAAQRSSDPEARARREAFLYLHFNLFETVYIDYNKVLPRTSYESEFWRSWDAWIRQFFRGSSEARALFTREVAKDIFAGGFVGYVNKILEEVAREEIAVPEKSAVEKSSKQPAV